MSNSRRTHGTGEVNVNTIVESLNNDNYSSQSEQVITVDVRHEGRARAIAVRRGVVAAAVTAGLLTGVLLANRGEEVYEGPARVDESGLCLEGVIRASTEVDSANAIAQKGMRMLGLNPEELGELDAAQAWLQFNGGSADGRPLDDSVLSPGEPIYLDGMCITKNGAQEFKPR